MVIRVLLEIILPTAGNVWTGFRWAKGGGVTEMLNLGPPEFAALATIFTGLLIALNWAWIDAMRPSTKFKRLQPQIGQLREQLRQYLVLLGNQASADDSFDLQSKIEKGITDLELELSKLSISTPTPNGFDWDMDLGEAWVPFLARLDHFAKTGRVKEARSGGEGLKRKGGQVR